jgi:hypothetical protein
VKTRAGADAMGCVTTAHRMKRTFEMHPSVIHHSSSLIFP